MLSDRLYKAAGIWIPLSAWCGTLPLTWDPNLRRVVPSPHAYFYIRIHFLHICVGILIYILMSINFYVDKDFANFNMTCSFALTVALTAQVMIMSVFMEDKCRLGINALLSFTEHVHREYLPNYDPNTDRTSRFIEAAVSCLFLGFGLGTMVTLGCIILYPYSPMFIGYLIPEGAPLMLKLIFCYMFPCFYTVIVVMNILGGITAFFAVGVYFVPFVVTEFRMGRPSYKSIPQLRSPERLMLAYRTAQIALGQGLTLCAVFLFPTQAIVYKLVILTSYMIVKHGQEMDKMSIAVLLSWGGAAMLFWSGILIMGGNLHFYGNKVLLSWKYHNWSSRHQKRLMNKFRNSCKPLQLNFGSAYVIRKRTVLKFIRSLSRGILRALLAL